MIQHFLSLMDSLPIFDGHEHLPYPKNTPPTFLDLLHYQTGDLISAGMPQDEIKEAFFRYYPKAKNTAYFRAVHIFIRDLYGIAELTPESLEELDRLIALSYQNAEAWYSEVLEKRCNIQYALTTHDGSRTTHPVIKPILYLDFFLRRSKISFYRTKHANASFADYLGYVDRWLEDKIAFGAVAGKFGTPYWRDLDFAQPDYEVAEKAYTEGSDRAPDFEGYVFHHILRKLNAHGLPAQFHTGHVVPQSADMKNYDTAWSNPSCFSRLAAKYPTMKLVLLHTGYPFSEEYFSIIKNVPNLYADFSWIYLISPTLAERNLHLAIELLPWNKVIGFGGDAQQVEMVYGHLQLAKGVIAKVFAEKTANGWLSLEEAESMISDLLYRNGAEIYGFTK